jgi:hypothetical protein
VALDVADLQFCDGGLRVTIRKSKTDQEGHGRTPATSSPFRQLRPASYAPTPSQ